MESDNKQLVDALKLESSEINGRIQEIYKAVYTLFGAVLPAILTVFGLILKDASGNYRSDLTFVFILALSVASLWGSSLWMEAISFIRYRYICFQPRWYRATGQCGEVDIAKYSLTGQELRWIPSTLLNIILFVVMAVAWWTYIPVSDTGKCLVALFCIIAALVGFVTVHFARMRYLVDLRRRHDGTKYHSGNSPAAHSME